MKYIVNPIAAVIGWIGVILALVGLTSIGVYFMYLADGIRK